MLIPVYNDQKNPRYINEHTQSQINESNDIGSKQTSKTQKNSKF